MRQVSGGQQGVLRALVSLLAELTVVNDAYSDVFSRLRRRKTLSLAAEMQWELLPPMSVRRLMRHVLGHQGGQLQDDASIVVLEWRTGTGRRLRP